MRLSALEHATVASKADALHLRVAVFLRQAALARRLPSPPVAAVNREQYIELARLVADLHELRRHADAGQAVTVTDALLRRLQHEVDRLRLELLGTVPLAGVAGRDPAPAADSP